MSREPSNWDQDLERAHAAEAVYDFGRFQVQGLTPEDFEGQTARHIVQAAQSAWEAGESGIEGVLRALQRLELMAAVGGRGGFMEALSEAGAPDLDRFRHLQRLRRLEALSLDASRLAARGELGGALERLQDALSAASHRDRVKIKDGAELAEGVFAGISDKARNGRRVYPGVLAIQNAVGDLPIGSCTVIGADTSVGKSSLALEMVIGLAEANGMAGLVSVEDPEEVTGSRLLGALSGVSSQEIQSGAISPASIQNLTGGIQKVSKIGPRMLFADCTGENELDVMAAMSQMATRGAKLIVVDYLTEIDSSKAQQDRRNEIRWIAKRLKAHAKRIGVALVLVSQLTRPNDKNPNTKPTKHHIKESGDVTAMAEVIILLWREKEDDSSCVNAWIAKCKWGGLGRWWKMKRARNGRLVEDTGNDTY